MGEGRLAEISIRLSRDGRLLFATRIIRMLSFGALTVVLLLYLTKIGFSDEQIGACLSLILAGDLCVTLVLTTYADRVGRRKTLAIGALLKVAAGATFALSTNFYMTVVSGILGVITPTGNDIGPFIAIEQAALADIAPSADRGGMATVFGWYQFIGASSQAAGALIAGWTVSALQVAGTSSVSAQRIVVLAYAFFGVLLFCLYCLLGDSVEPRARRDSPVQPAADQGSRSWMPNIGIWSRRSKLVVMQLSGLFALDAFAGGFSMQTFIALWFERRWSLDVGHLGSIIMAVNLLAALSGLVVGPLVARYGAVNVMVLTHLPSNLLNMLVPLMPSKESAVLMLLARFSISQMDVPARQAFVSQMVSSHERSAANGITNIARSIGLLIAPLLLGLMTVAQPGSLIFNLPWFICGVLKVIYDLTLYAMFKATPPAGAVKEEERQGEDRDDEALCACASLARDEDGSHSSAQVVTQGQECGRGGGTLTSGGGEEILSTSGEAGGDALEGPAQEELHASMRSHGASLSIPCNQNTGAVQAGSQGGDGREMLGGASGGAHNRGGAAMITGRRVDRDIGRRMLGQVAGVVRVVEGGRMETSSLIESWQEDVECCQREGNRATSEGERADGGAEGGDVGGVSSGTSSGVDMVAGVTSDEICLERAKDRGGRSR